MSFLVGLCDLNCFFFLLQSQNVDRPAKYLNLKGPLQKIIIMLHKHHACIIKYATDVFCLHYERDVIVIHWFGERTG